MKLDEVDKRIRENNKKKKEIEKRSVNATSNIKKLFANIRKLNTYGINILSEREEEKDEKINLYGVNVTCFPTKKRMMRSVISSLSREGKLFEVLGFDENNIKDEKDRLQYEQMRDYLIVDCNGTEAQIKEQNMVANLLIKKMFSHEGNQSNMAFMFDDENLKYFCTGDMEIPQEVQLLYERISLASDLHKIAHHYSRTSNTPNFLSAVLSDSLEEGRTPIFTVSMSYDDFKKYGERIEKLNETMGISAYGTYEGTLRYIVKDGQIFIHNKTIKEDCKDYCIAALRQALEVENPAERDKFIEQANKMEYCSKNGIPKEEFIELYTEVEYQKYANFVKDNRTK